MRAFNRLIFPLVVAGLSAACSNGTGTSSSAGGSSANGSTTTANASGTTATGATAATGATSATSTGTGSAGGIPDPGTSNQVDQDFTNKDPNDTPQTATPLGIAKNAGVHIWVGGNTIGGSDTADYFVFKSGPAAGPFTFDICFGAPITAMTGTLWKVANGALVMPPVGMWMSNATCVSDTTSAPMLAANTEYLFGLTATGGAGSYGA